MLNRKYFQLFLEGRQARDLTQWKWKIAPGMWSWVRERAFTKPNSNRGPWISVCARYKCWL